MTPPFRGFGASTKPGAIHPDTLTIRNNLIFWFGRAGRVDFAVAQFQQLLTDYQRVLGPDHPDTLRTRSNLAFWLRQTGQVDEAVAQFQQLLTDQRRVLGPDHPDTLRTRGYLGT
jgi:Flp pilus assembly protein TadD